MFDFKFLYFFVCCVLLFCTFCHIVLYIIATHSFIIILYNSVCVGLSHSIKRLLTYLLTYLIETRTVAGGAGEPVVDVDERVVVWNAEDVVARRIAGDRLQLRGAHVVRYADHQKGDALPASQWRGAGRRRLVGGPRVKEHDGDVGVLPTVARRLHEHPRSKDIQRRSRVAYPTTEKYTHRNSPTIRYDTIFRSGCTIHT